MPIDRELFAFRCDSDIGQHAALQAGFGIGFCQVALGKRDGLVPVLRDAVGFELGVWLTMHKDLATPNERAAAFLLHVAGRLAKVSAGTRVLLLHAHAL